MRTMKDSGIEWIGEIPESWSVYRLKHLLSKEKGAIKAGPFGSSLTSTDMQYHDVKVFTQRTVLDNDFVSGDEYVSFEKYDELKGFTANEEDILITTRGTIGKTVVVPHGRYGILHPCLIKMRLDNSLVNKELLCRVFNETNIFEEQLRLSSNATTIDVIYTQNLMNIFVPLAPPDEQNRMASYLDKKCAEIDALIKAKEKTNALLKEQRQSIIYEAVTKGLDPNAPMKDSGIEWIGKIPESWSIRRVRSEFSFGKGLSITKADLRENGVSVISYGQIHSKTNIGTTVKKEMIRFVDEEFLGTNLSSLAEKGDIVFADTSEDLLGCGNCVYIDIDKPIFAGYHTIIARPIERKNAKYFAYLFSTDAWRSQIRSKVTGVKLFSITQVMLRDALIVLPCEKDMNDIVDTLDEKCSAIDKIILANNKTIEKLKEYRKSVIFEAVTGKVEV